MADAFVGEIRPAGFNFAPTGWAFCAGQLLPISQNTALFSLLGTFYGGDGKTTFALPDLRGRTPLGQGQGPGLSLYDLGQESGEESVTLGVAQIPQHNHTVTATDVAASSLQASGHHPALSARNVYGAPTGAMASGSVGPTGGNQPHNNLQPYIVVNYIIALQGIFPPRS